MDPSVVEYLMRPEVACLVPVALLGTGVLLGLRVAGPRRGSDAAERGLPEFRGRGVPGHMQEEHYARASGHRYRQHPNNNPSR